MFVKNYVHIEIRMNLILKEKAQNRFNDLRLCNLYVYILQLDTLFVNIFTSRVDNFYYINQFLIIYANILINFKCQ